MRVTRNVLGFALLFLMLTAGPVFAMGTVWIVDDSGGPGVDFTTIQDGINGAADHDVLLVHGGYYSGGWATIDGKSLTICSAATATVILDGLYFRVKNLASDQTVILRGFQSSQFHPVSETAMEFMDNVGMIWVEDCDLFGGFYAGTVPLVRIMSSDRVIFQHTDLNGLYTGLTFEDPVSGLEAWDSSVYLHDCVVWGGTGVGFHGFYMTEGASAVKVHGGFLYTAGGEFHGGMAGAGDGGHGVHLVDGNPAYYHANDVHDGGVGFLPGVNGSPIKVDSGFEQAPSFAPNGFKASSPHRSNTKVTLSIDGAPDSTVILLFNFAPSSIFLQGYGGPLLMEPSNLLLWNLGTLPPAGTMTLNINVPPLTGFDSVGIYHQPVFLSDGSPPALGPGSFILYIGD